MAAAGVAALAPILSGLTSAFTNQGRSPVAQHTPRVDTSTAAIAAAHDAKTRRAAAKNAREERLAAILTDPQVMGVLVTIGGLWASANIPFHSDPGVNARLRGLSAASCVLMGLGRAGVGDMTSLALAGAAGATLGASGPQGIGGIIPNIPGTDIPAYAMLGPAGTTAWLVQELRERIGG